MAKITNFTSTAIADAVASAPASAATPMRGGSRKAAGVKPAARNTQSRQRAAKPAPAEVADTSTASDNSSASRTTKASIVLELLRQPAGVSIADLSAATGWQAHSVRGFLSAVVRKKHCLTVMSEIGDDSVRRYHTEDAATSPDDQPAC